MIDLLHHGEAVQESEGKLLGKPVLFFNKQQFCFMIDKAKEYIREGDISQKLMILLIDNYDSFSYNLYQYVGEFEPQIKMIRNDELSLAQIECLAPEKIILSPVPPLSRKNSDCPLPLSDCRQKYPPLLSENHR